MVGRLLGLLDSLGIADNTIVMYSTDNGAEKFSWPDGGSSPFRNEKASNWEGAYRVPGMIRWPGTVKPGTVLNDIVSHEDWVPTLVSAAGNPNVTQQLLAGTTVGGKTFKVHLDGYNLTDYLSGKGPDPRKDFFYFNDDGCAGGVAVQSVEGRVRGAARRRDSDVWQDPFVPLRVPEALQLRSDPFEIGDHESISYDKWHVEHVYVLVPAQDYVAQFLSTFVAFPPRQKAGSFSLDQALQSLQ